MRNQNPSMCMNHSQNPVLFDNVCRSCVELFAKQGDLKYVKFLNDEKKEAEKVLPKEKKPKKAPVAGPDFYEFMADAVQSRLDLWFSGTDDFYYYDNATGLWKSGADVAVKAYLTEYRRKTIKANPDNMVKEKITTIFKETIAILKGRLAKTIQSMPVPDKRYIPLGNGIFDIETKALIPYSKDFFFTTKIPWDYNPKATCERFSGMMNDWYTPEKVITGWEIMALCLFRGYPIHKFFILYSSGGQGKTTFFSILQGLLGYNNVSQVALDKLHKSFAAVDLYNKYANIADEAPPETISNTEVLKQATGDSVILADRKHKTTISFKSYATMIFSLNQHDDRPPSTSDETDGFYRRFCMIEFNGSKAKANPIKDLSNIIIADKDEMEGILKKAIDALIEMKSRKWEMSLQESIDETRKKHQDAANPLRVFIEKFCTLEEGRNTTKLVFSKALNKYLDAIGRKYYSPKALYNEMAGIGVFSDRLYDGYNKTSYWLAIHVDELKLNSFVKNLDSEMKIDAENLRPLANVQKLKHQISELIKHAPNLKTDQICSILGATDSDLVDELISELNPASETPSEIDESVPF